MNAVVRTLNQTTVFPRLLTWSFSSKRHLTMISLMFAVLFSAFSLVYVKDMNRRLMGDLQTLQGARDHLRTQWSQLLLEESTWSSQSRVEQIAKQHFIMAVPVKQERQFI